MWAFFDFGLLMPALVPAKYANTPAVLAWTNNGEYELQVRGRLREHLEYFMTVYMEEGTFNPTIQATPDKDYNYRFYTTREAYAEGIKQAALAMDYEKFKVTSDRFKWNKKYHTILTSIWSKVCDLNTPGGIWGPRSSNNPTGYSPTSKYSSWGRSGFDYQSAHDDYDNMGGSITRVGDSFGPRAGEEAMAWAADDDYGDFGNLDFGDERHDWEMDEHGEWQRVSSDMDYTPDSEVRRQAILDEMDDIGIPPEEWQDYLMEHEWHLVSSEAEKRIKRARKAFRRGRTGRRSRSRSRA